MTAADADDAVVVSRAQVRAAKELVRLRGEQHVHPVVRQVAGLEYEQQLFKALQRQRPDAAALRRQATGPGDIGADFVLDDGNRLLVIEAKSVRAPLGATVVNQAERYLTQRRIDTNRPVGVLVVSRSGFTSEAERAAADDPDIRLVTWVDRDDDRELATAIRALSTQPAQT